MMKNLIFLLLAGTLPILTQAQDHPAPNTGGDAKTYLEVDEVPHFAGCEEEPVDSLRRECADDKMLAFIYDNLQYPEEALSLKTEGMVVVQFIIEADGTVTNATIVRDIGNGCGDEAVRIVKSMPAFIPGKLDGLPVRVKYFLPVKFKIGGKLPFNAGAGGKGGAAVPANDPAALLGYNPAPGQPGIIQIKYAIKVKGPVRLQILDKAGHPLRTLVDEFKERGSYTVDFDPAAQYLEAGEYLYRLEADGEVFAQPIKW